MKQLLTDASVKLRLCRELRFVPEEIVDWNDRDFLPVMNRSQSEGVLIAPLETLHVVAFRLQKRRANSVGRVEAIICDICATWQRGSNSAVITFPKANSSVSFLVCADLNCSRHVRDKTEQSKFSRTQLRENMTSEARQERLKVRLRNIVQELVVDN